MDKESNPAKKYHVSGVITQSENLSKNQREVISEAFHCPVHNRYSTEEFGVLGMEYDQESGFEMNCCNYIIEVLDLHKDEPVKEGEIGRVVVTDLHSNAMPLVRYETGDLAIVGSYLDNERRWVGNLSELSGRTVQILFNTKGNPLYPLHLDEIMDPYHSIAQYQLIQQGQKDYTIKLVLGKKFQERTFDIDKLKAELNQWLGDDALITITYVEYIEQLPSGKRPYIINKYQTFKA